MNNIKQTMSLSVANIFAHGLVGNGGAARSSRAFQIGSFFCLGRAEWHLKKSG